MDALFDLLRGILPPGAGGAMGIFVSAALTFMVFTYVAGDNFFFRVAQHLLIGVVAAYAVVVAVHQVLIAQLVSPLAARTDPAWWGLLGPLALGVLLLAKAAPGVATGRWRGGAWLANLPVAFLLGVGAALGVSGGVLGTLAPQLWAASQSLFAGAGPELTAAQRTVQTGGNIVALLGTLGALLSFQFVRIVAESGGGPATGSGRGWAGFPARALDGLVSAWSRLGRFCIWVALGALLAGLILSRVTLLVERVQFLMETFRLAVR